MHLSALRSLWLLISFLALLLACGDDGGGDGGGGNNGPGIEGEWVEVFLTSLPEGPGSEQVFLLALSPDGKLIASDDRPLRLGGSLSVDVDVSPIDVVVYVPADPAWTDDQPPEDGHYSIVRGVDDLPVQLATTRWTQSGSLSDAPDDGANIPGEGPIRRTLSGVVTFEGNVVPNALVRVEGQAWDHSDGNGEFTLEELFDGPATLVVSGPGFEESMSIDISAATVDTQVQFQVANMDPTPTQRRIWGQVTDRETGSPVADVEVWHNNSVAAVTDANGDWEFDWPGQPALSFRGTDYGVHYAIPACLAEECRVNVAITPLAQDFYGRWNYCHTVDRDSDQRYVFDFMLNPAPQFPQTFNDDGTTDRHGRSIGNWIALESSRAPLFTTIVPFPAGFTTAYVEAPTDLVGYRFEDGYLVNYETIATRSYHYFKPEGSDLECLGGGGGGNPTTCEELLEGFDQTQALAMLAGTYPHYCGPVGIRGSTECFSNDDCDGSACREGFIVGPDNPGICLESLCPHPEVGLNCTELDAEELFAMGPSAATSDPVTYTATTVQVGPVTVTYPGTHEVFAGRPDCTDEGYFLNTMTFEDPTSGFEVWIDYALGFGQDGGLILIASNVSISSITDFFDDAVGNWRGFSCQSIGIAPFPEQPLQSR